mgnify:CR=1 FL=1
MALPWVRLDTGLPDHPKFLALIGDKKKGAALLYCMGLSYCGRHESDGFIPAAALPFIHGTRSEADALVDVGLWHHTAGGYEVNDWREYQPSSDESKKRRESLKRASHKGGCRKNHGADCRCYETATPAF